MKINELIAFGRKSQPKRTTIKKKPEKFDDTSIRDRVASRRKAFAKGDKDAFASGWKKTNEDSDMVVTKASVRGVIIDMISDKIMKSNDFEQLSQWLKMIVGKELKPRGELRYTITSGDIKEAINKLKAR